MKKNRKTILLGIALAAVLFIGLFAVQKQAMGQYELKECIIVKKDIPIGTDITKENAKEYFESAKVMASMVTDTVVRKESAIYGFYTGIAMHKGTIVYSDMLCCDKDETADISDPVEVSISVNSVADGVAGTLRKGDYVYVYFTDPEGTTEMFGRSPLYIKQSFSSSGEPIAASDDFSAASIFTLLIEKGAADEFCFSLQNRNATLVRADQ